MGQKVITGDLNVIGTISQNGKQMPTISGVSEHSSKSSFPSTGNTNVIYIDASTGKIYRWNNSAYVELSAQEEVPTMTELEVRRMFRTLVDITVNITNGTYAGDAQVYTKEAAQVMVTPAFEYKLPDTITLTNATFTYDSTTGGIEIYNVKDAVVITVICEKLPDPETPTLDEDTLTIQEFSGADSYDIYSDGHKVGTVQGE